MDYGTHVMNHALTHGGRGDNLRLSRLSESQNPFLPSASGFENYNRAGLQPACRRGQRAKGVYVLYGVESSRSQADQEIKNSPGKHGGRAGGL